MPSQEIASTFDEGTLSSAENQLGAPSVSDTLEPADKSESSTSSEHVPSDQNVDTTTADNIVIESKDSPEHPEPLPSLASDEAQNLDKGALSSSTHQQAAVTAVDQRSSEDLKDSPTDKDVSEAQSDVHDTRESEAIAKDSTPLSEEQNRPPSQSLPIDENVTNSTPTIASDARILSEVIGPGETASPHCSVQAEAAVETTVDPASQFCEPNQSSAKLEKTDPPTDAAEPSGMINPSKDLTDTTISLADSASVAPSAPDDCSPSIPIGPSIAAPVEDASSAPEVIPITKNEDMKATAPATDSVANPADSLPLLQETEKAPAVDADKLPESTPMECTTSAVTEQGDGVGSDVKTSSSAADDASPEISAATLDDSALESGRNGSEEIGIPASENLMQSASQSSQDTKEGEAVDPVDVPQTVILPIQPQDAAQAVASPPAPSCTNDVQQVVSDEDADDPTKALVIAESPTEDPAPLKEAPTLNDPVENCSAENAAPLKDADADKTNLTQLTFDYDASAPVAIVLPPKSQNTTESASPVKRGRGRKRGRWLADGQNENGSGETDQPPPVLRQSSRIAKLREKEDEERRKQEAERLQRLKEEHERREKRRAARDERMKKMEEKQQRRQQKTTERTDEPYEESEDDSSSDDGSPRKKGKKKRGRGKKKKDRPWDSSESR